MQTTEVQQENVLPAASVPSVVGSLSISRTIMCTNLTSTQHQDAVDTDLGIFTGVHVCGVLSENTESYRDVGTSMDDFELYALHATAVKKSVGINKILNAKSIKQNCFSTIPEEINTKPPMVFDKAVVTKKPGLVGRFSDLILGPKMRLARTHGRVDEDLLARLRTYSAFMPRTMSLAQSLKMRAIRFLDEYNCTNLTTTAQMELIVCTVAEAMCISEVEKTFVKRMNETQKERERYNSYFRDAHTLQNGGG